MVIVHAIATYTDVMDLAVMGLVIPLVMPIWKIGPADIALLSMITLPLMIIFSYAAGFSMDAIGRKKVWMLGNLVCGIACLLSILSQNWLQFCAYRAVQQAFTSWATQGVYTMLAEESPPDKRSTLTAVATTFPGLVASLSMGGIVSLKAIYPWIDWWTLMIWLGVWNIIATALGAAVLREPPIWYERKQLIKEGKLPKERRLELHKLLFKKEYRGPYWTAMIVAVIFGFQAVFAVPNTDYGSWFTVAVLKFDAVVIGQITMATSWFGLIIRHLVGYTADKIGRLKAGLLYGTLATIITQVMWRLPYFLPVGPNLPLIVAWVICTYIFGHAAATDLGWFMMIGESIPTQVRATGMALQWVLRRVLLLIFSPMVGFLAAQIQPPIELFAFYQLAWGIIGLAIILFALKRGYETVGKRLE
ncbi:MAG: MFS transporter [candidate division WOR-3 bacterium]